MNETYRAAAEAMRAELQAKVAAIMEDARMADVLKLHQALNGMEDLLQEPRTELGAYFGIAGVGTVVSAPSRPAVRFDEFVGLTPLEAAKRYLRRCTDARPFPEIMDAIREGGIDPGSEDKLRMGLSRSTLDIIKINDRYGMLEKYPDARDRRGTNKRKGAKATTSTAPAEPSSSGEFVDPNEPEVNNEAASG